MPEGTEPLLVPSPQSYYKEWIVPLESHSKVMEAISPRCEDPSAPLCGGMGQRAFLVDPDFQLDRPRIFSGESSGT
jgi:hypothetical protein